MRLFGISPVAFSENALKNPGKTPKWTVSGEVIPIEITSNLARKPLALIQNSRPTKRIFIWNNAALAYP
jgi:hypothetical protein